MHDLTHDMATPGLSTLLGKGQWTRENQSWLATAFGLSLDPPAAPLRLLALNATNESNRYLCLDPVNIAFIERSVVVANPNELHLTENEAQALALSLAEVFAELGEIMITTANQWHLRLHATAPALPAFAALPDFIGRRADQGLPTDPQWRNLLNQAQVLLHAHPVNQAREARGQQRVNSLWPWGGGSLPTDARTAHDVIVSANPVLQGLAKLCGVPADLPSAGWQASAYKNPLVILDNLANARGQADGMRWREALAALDANWFVPILDGLRTGEIARLKIIVPASNGNHHIELSQRALLKFWRKPASLSAFAA